MEKENKKNISSLLSLKTAPQGNIENDFRVALYVVAAMYQLDFSKISNLGMCTSLLGDVGYLGDTSKFKSKDYFDALDDLVNKGALVQIGKSKVYVAPNDVKSIIAKVRAEEISELRSGDQRYYKYTIQDEDGNDYSLSTDFVLLPNDEVEAIVPKLSDIAYVNKITKVRQCVLGRLMPVGKNNLKLVSDEQNLRQIKFNFASVEDVGEAKSGDVVIAQIVKRIDANQFLVKTREIVKDIGNLNNIIVMAVLRNDIPNSWPDNLVKSLSRIPTQVSEKEAHGRVDLRELPLMTIDGEDARDFDDAVFCQKEGTGWRLYVSIADVSYYVKVGTLLDKEAVNRCNSCYFPNFVIPMLPEKLSNGICSLNPEVDRLCMTCEMVISKDGAISSYKFYPAIMRSHARLTYTEAWQMISEEKAFYEEHNFAIPYVKELHNLYKAFLKNRHKRGGMSIESDELHFVFNENMDIEGLKPLERNDAHKLIEECMVAANVAAATFVAEHKSQTLYRVHARPTEKKLSLLQTQLARFGLSLRGGDEPSPKDYMNLAESVANREDGKLLNELILRSMSKAEYTPENIGHFGLALDKYAHFTSPIRRYADLQLHRVIKYILEKEQKPNWGRIGARAYTKAELVTLGTKCTDREIAADMAEKEVDASLACIFMEKHIGEVVLGTVTACTKFGVFVRLDDFGVDGMIYIGNFNSYMTFNEKNQTLSSDWGEVYGVGKKIKVVVESVNYEEHKINLLPNTLSKKELKGLENEREHILAKRAKISQNAPQIDKVSLLNTLKDISTSKEASPDDLVTRSDNKKLNTQVEFAESPYNNAVSMGEVISTKKTNKKKKKGRK